MNRTVLGRLILIRNTFERRLEMLKLEGNGLEPPEIVKELSEKFGVTPRAVYKDFETRGTWQPKFQEFQKAVAKLCNRHEQLYRKAVISYMQAETDRERIAALNLMRQINIDLAELTGAKAYNEMEPEDYRIKWEDPESCKKLYTSDTNPT